MKTLTKKNVILILARGGNQKLARLNLRLIKNKPLLYYILKSSLQVESSDVYVTSDSEEILALTKNYGGKTIPRPKSLTKDSTKIENIIKHSINFLHQQNFHYENCLVVSPVFPLLSKKSMELLIKKINIDKKTIWGFSNHKYNDIISVNKKNQLELIRNKNSFGLIKKIVAFKINSFLKHNSFHKPFYGLELPENEVITIKDYHDLNTISTILDRKRIAVIVNGTEKLGLGHVYRMLAVLNEFRNDEILILMDNNKKLGNYKFKEQYYNIKFYKNKNQLFSLLHSFNPDIIINDILKTSKNYILYLKQQNYFVVNFDDMGSGSNYADLVINPLHFSKNKNPKKFYGSDFSCIRDEFRMWKTDKIKKNVKNILITFGGTDPHNLTISVLTSIRKSNIHDILFTVVLGIGYKDSKRIVELISKMKNENFKINLLQNSNIMAKHISEADFVITSNGITVLEIASLNTPMICIPANKREEEHPFSKQSGGAIIISRNNISNDELLIKTINNLLKYETRIKLIKNLKKYELLDGINKIEKVINQEYNKFKLKLVNEI